MGGKKKKKSLVGFEIHVADLFLEEITKNVIKSPRLWELWVATILSQKRDFWMQLETIAIAACEPRNAVCLGSSCMVDILLQGWEGCWLSSRFPFGYGRIVEYPGLEGTPRAQGAPLPDLVFQELLPCPWG